MAKYPQKIWKQRKTPPRPLLCIQRPAINYLQYINNYKHTETNFWKSMNRQQRKTNLQQSKSRNSITSQRLNFRNWVTMTPWLRLCTLLQILYFRKWVTMKCLMVSHLNFQVISQQSYLLWIICLIQVWSQDNSNLWNNYLTQHKFPLVTHLYTQVLIQKYYLLQIICLIKVWFFF